MAAINRTRISSFGVVMFVVAIAAALLVGGTGGYVLRGSGLRASGQAVVAPKAPATTSVQVPDWVLNYENAHLIAACKVDRPTVQMENLPLWVQKYMSEC